MGIRVLICYITVSIKKLIAKFCIVKNFLLLSQEGQLSVSGKRMHTNTGELLKKLSLSRKMCG